MIDFIKIDKSEPYELFKSFYNAALLKKQKNIEAICISSYSHSKNEVTSRFVNLKFINFNRFYFFSNYESPKALDFKEHNQISAVIYWNEINTQIRFNGNISIADAADSDSHFKNRSIEKNALAISSKQSQSINSYKDIKEEYNKTLNLIQDKVPDRPEYWGGFFFEPYYIEFWEGEKNRLNKRISYNKLNNVWSKSILQP